MPNGSNYGNLLLPSGFHHIQRFGSSQSALAQFLYPAAWRDVVFVHDHFTGPALATHKWTADGVNGTDFDPPATQLLGGVAQASVNNVAQDQNSIRSDAVWAGDNNCGVEFRWKIDDIDTLLFEIGFNDPLTAYGTTDNGAIDNHDTPTITNGATDVALVSRDSGATLTTMQFVTDGSTGSMNTTGTNLGTRTPTNAVYQTVRVQLTQTASAVAASHAYVFDQNGALQEDAQHGAVIASQIKGDVLMEARLYVEALTTAARVCDIDAITIWQDLA
jgi:hypothetical protein